MRRVLFRCSLIGGLVAFIWGVLSWMALPMHKDCFKKFKDESQVAEAIRENTHGDGMYILPNTLHYNCNTPQKEIHRGARMLENGPFMFASVRMDGLGGMSVMPFVLAIITQIIGAFIVTWMLLQSKITGFRQKVGFVTLFGLAIGILSQIPDAVWWGFSIWYVFINMLDLVIAWFLAGLVIAKFSTKSS